MSNTRVLAGASPLFAAFIIIAIISALLPLFASAACYQTASYPPQTICTDDSGGSTSNPGTVSSGGTVNSGGTVMTGPVAFWNFDESAGPAIDISGNGNTGSLENGATRYVGVQQGNKLELDGENDRMRVDPTSSTMNSMNAFTLAAWVRPTENAGVIMRKGNTQNGRFNFGIASDGKLYLRAGHLVSQGAWRSSAVLPLNTWSYVAVTYAFGSDGPTFYVGGTPVGRTLIQSPAGEITPDTPYLYIGNTHDFSNSADPGYDSAFEGRMDLVRIYNRVLGASEVLSLKGATPDTTSPQPPSTTPPSTGSSVPPTTTNPYVPYNPIPPVQLPDGTWVQPAGAPTIASLYAEVERINAQIAALSGGAPGSPAVCPVLTRNLMRGMSGDDVRQLQQFLIARGLLAAGNDTGYFGALTEAAVQSFQSQQGIVSSGTPDTTGFGLVGPMTRAAIQAACSQ